MNGIDIRCSTLSIFYRMNGIDCTRLYRIAWIALELSVL